MLILGVNFLFSDFLHVKSLQKIHLNWFRLSTAYCRLVLYECGAYTLRRRMNKCLPEVYEWMTAAVDFYPVLFDINYTTMTTLHQHM